MRGLITEKNQSSQGIDFEGWKEVCFDWLDASWGRKCCPSTSADLNSRTQSEMCENDSAQTMDNTTFVTLQSPVQ